MEPKTDVDGDCATVDLQGETCGNLMFICVSEHCGSCKLVKEHIESTLVSKLDEKFWSCSKLKLSCYQFAAIVQLLLASEKSKLTVLGSYSTVADDTVHGFYLSQYRRLRLNRNERVSVLSTEDQLIAVQLLLAARNKKDHGEFNVEVSSVLDTTRRLMSYRATESQDTCADEDIVDLNKEYESFKRECNLVDWLDVYQSVKNHSTQNSVLQERMAGSFLVINPNMNDLIEGLMVKLLCGDKPIKKGFVTTSLDESFTPQMETPDSACVVLEDLSMVELKSLPLSVCEDKDERRKSTCEIYIEQIMLGYLSLLVNSRNELSLARVLNVPDRGIDHHAFTDVKHAAQASGLSMYQTLTSYVVRLRLGGKGYSASSNSLLSPHCKGLSDFTDLMHSLQTKIEENLEAIVALKKVIAAIKRSLLSKPSKLFNKQSVDLVCDRLIQDFEQVIDQIKSNAAATPTRSASDGGTSLGRRTLRVVCALLDHYATRAMHQSCTNVLTDLYTSQGTPVCVPSLMDKFRSPDEELIEEVKPLRERLNQSDISLPKPQKRLSNGRIQSCFAWATEESNSCHASEDVMDFIRSKTIVHPAENTSFNHSIRSVEPSEKRKSSAKRSLPMSPGKENIHPENEQHTSDSGAQTAKKQNLDSSKTVCNNKSVKAGKSSASSGPKKGGAAKKKTALPMIAGQSKLSAFFK